MIDLAERVPRDPAQAAPIGAVQAGGCGGQRGRGAQEPSPSGAGPLERGRPPPASPGPLLVWKSRSVINGAVFGKKIG